MTKAKQAPAKLETFSSFAAALRGERVNQQKKLESLNIDKNKFAMVMEMLSMGGQLPLHAMREAIGTGAWDSILLDALHKRLQKGWKNVMEALHWSKIPSMRKNVVDFKSQYAIQVGDFTTLDEVPEKGDYHNTEFSDDRASYAVKKYGNIFGVSYESAVNDDLGALGSIVERFGGASARTIEKFVFETLIDDNPTVYDAEKLFTDGTGTRGQKNALGTSKALSEANLEAAIKLMRNFTDIDGNPLDMAPKYLVVHPDEEFTALRILNSVLIPGSANNDVNVLKGRLELIVTSRITTARWYVIADPAQSETIEMGFLGGRETPEIFEENADSGHSFSYDEKRYKGRVIFGGCVTDWRGFVGGNFAP